MKRREKLSISIFSNQYYSKHYLRMMYSKTTIKFCILIIIWYITR